jgi:hypothetical protein
VLDRKSISLYNISKYAIVQEPVDSFCETDELEGSIEEEEEEGVRDVNQYQR